MKYCFVLCIGLLLNACINENSLSGERPYKEMSKEIKLADFSKVSFSGATTANIQMGDFKILVKGDSADLANLNVKVEEGKLTYTYKGNSSRHFGLEFKINMPSLESVDVSGASNVTLGKFNDEKYAAEVSGASTLLANDFAVKSLDISLSGASKANVTVSEKMKAAVSGASSLYYKGSPVVNSEVTGASTLEKN